MADTKHAHAGADEKSSLQRSARGVTLLGIWTAIVNAIRKARDVTPLGAWARSREKAKHEAWDQLYGVETSTYVGTGALRPVGSNLVHAQPYVPCRPFEMDRRLRTFKIDYPQTTLIDLGAGKGRVVLLALGLPFKRVVGIEFSPELARIARDNLHRYRGKVVCRNVEILCQDAAEYAPPEEPLVLFLFNPFDAEIVRCVAQNLMSSWARAPRRILVYYVLAEHADVWESAGFQLVYRSRTGAVLESPPR